MRLPALLRRLLRQPEPGPGERGEQVAERHLRAQHYKTLARNLANRLGEIDLLMLAPDGKTVVFVEVKTAAPGRRSGVRPELRVGKKKQHKIASVAAKLIARHKLTGRPIRFDVVGVDLHDDTDPEVRHYPGAFESPW